ncbi:hypothetical protein EV424DRAFT_1558757 [Suillus variegatus]|nr:hypothetical protein EV424DRAFT_1558757 [Suillus variegatus]
MREMAKYELSASSSATSPSPLLLISLLDIRCHYWDLRINSGRDVIYEKGIIPSMHMVGTWKATGSHIPQNTVDVVRKKVSNRRGVSYRRRQLVEDKAKIVQSNNSHKRFSSALWRFPAEIPAQIFLYYMLENEDWTPAPNLAPMVLTAVCRRWREVAVDTSSLWRKLRLEVGHGNWQQRAFCYDSYLKRSRGRQLSLALERHDDNDGMEGLEELVMYTTVSVPVLTIAHSVVRSITKLLPNMRTLKLMDLWFDLKMLSGFNPLAWVNLTNLGIVVDSLDCFPCLLRLCPNLSSLTIVGIFRSAVETPAKSSYSKLRSLRISGNLDVDWIGSLGLFAIITLPNLRAVEVRNVGVFDTVTVSPGEFDLWQWSSDYG